MKFLVHTGNFKYRFLIVIEPNLPHMIKCLLPKIKEINNLTMQRLITRNIDSEMTKVCPSLINRINNCNVVQLYNLLICVELWHEINRLISSACVISCNRDLHPRMRSWHNF